MSILPHYPRRKQLLIAVLILCLLLTAVVVITRRNVETHICLGSDMSFSVLMLGDSQMAGAGWDGGYANLISDIYPNATVINLAQSGTLLSNWEIPRQWELYLSEADSMPDFVLLDGGGNDLFYLNREGFKDEDMAMIKESLCSLIERIHETSPDTHILYLLMPPFEEWTDSEDGPPSYEIQERYWKQMNILASSYEYVTVLDLFSLNPFHYPCYSCYLENMADSLHLNETGYRKTFEYINNALVSRLAQLLEE